MQGNKPGATGVRRVINAYGYSMKGLRAAFMHEAAFRQELALMVLLLPLALWLGQDGTQRAVLAASLFLVLITELLNSGLEALVDRVGSEHHELSGRAKDIGSAAVFVALVNVAVVWGIIAYGRFC